MRSTGYQVLSFRSFNVIRGRKNLSEKSGCCAPHSLENLAIPFPAISEKDLVSYHSTHIPMVHSLQRKGILQGYQVVRSVQSEHTKWLRA